MWKGIYIMEWMGWGWVEYIDFGIKGGRGRGGGLHFTPKFITIFFPHTKCDISLYKEIVTGCCHSGK